MIKDEIPQTTSKHPSYAPAEITYESCAAEKDYELAYMLLKQEFELVNRLYEELKRVIIRNDPTEIKEKCASICEALVNNQWFVKDELTRRAVLECAKQIRYHKYIGQIKSSPLPYREIAIENLIEYNRKQVLNNLPTSTKNNPNVEPYLKDYQYYLNLKDAEKKNNVRSNRTNRS